MVETPYSSKRRTSKNNIISYKINDNKNKLEVDITDLILEIIFYYKNLDYQNISESLLPTLKNVNGKVSY